MTEIEGKIRPAVVHIDKSPDRVLFFDGICVLCNGIIDLLLEIDTNKKLTFASLQSGLGQALLEKEKLCPESLESAIFYDRNKVYLHSDAVIQVCAHLPFPWRSLRLLRILPQSVRDFIYCLVARNRYRIFGKHDNCRLPTPQQQERFL